MNDLQPPFNDPKCLKNMIIVTGDIMYVYIQSEPHLWTVGFYDPNGKWHPETDHESPEKAADRVAYLNGSKK